MPTLVQSISHTQSTTTTLITRLGVGAGNGTVNVTAGNTLVAYCGTLSSGRTFTVADNVNAGNYNLDRVQNSNTSIAIASYPNVLAGDTTITATVSASVTGTITVEEWTGFLFPTPLDKAVQGSGNALTTLTSNSTGTLTTAPELALTMCQLSGTSTGNSLVVQSPFTVGPSSPATSQATGYLVVNTTAALTSTFNWTGSFNATVGLVTYKLAPISQIPPFYNRRSVLYFT